MSEEIKRIPIKEFRSLGFIQEINRRILHPCGLAIEVIVDQETGEEALGGIWDYRDDPEGIYFGDDTLTWEKFQTVDRLLKGKEETRVAELGYVVQPVPGEDNA